MEPSKFTSDMIVTSTQLTGLKSNRFEAKASNSEDLLIDTECKCINMLLLSKHCRGSTQNINLGKGEGGAN